MQDEHERKGWTKVKRGVFPGNLRSRRKGRGLTQAVLAAQLHTTQSRVSEWEHGKSQPSLEQFRLLAEILDVSMTVLLLGAGEGV